jgi:uncharacterized membrane protein
MAIFHIQQPMTWMAVVTITVAALMVGNEVTVAAFLHPALYRLRDDVHAAAAHAFARLFGRVMPPWYAATLLLTLINLWLCWNSEPAARWLLAASGAFWLVSIVYTIVFPLPINNRIARWELGALPSNWREERRRWDSYHQFRVGLLITALLCLILGLLKSGAVC